MRRLSKSKLIAHRQCPKRLWLELHRPELRDDSGAEAVFRIGNEVGEVARKIYDPEGSGSFVDREELGYAEAIDRSDVLLARYQGPIFEAALQGGGVVAFTDVMLPAVNQYDQQGWRLIEVKSASSMKDCYRDDLAIQVHLADQMGLPLVSAAIAHIDNTFVYRGDGNYEGLFREVDLLHEDDFPRFEVEEWILEAQDTAELAEEPEIPMGPHCSDPYDCPFAGYCGRDRPQAEYPLSSLPKLSAARRVAIEALGISDLREVPDLLLTDNQNHVREVTLSGQTWFDAEGAAAALSGHGFPAWFLDFETVMMPVPVWKNTRPYQQIPFQFSLHRVEADGAMHHDAFLDVSGADPTRSLAETLIGCVVEEGPVFAYNAGFENRVLRELGQRFPDLATSLTAIAERLVDLHPIAKAHFYAPSQHGSWSLKAVLPAACPDLSYSDLDGVTDGVAAGEAFREAILPGTTAERRDEIERQLLAYCHLDTLAMVRLWEVFRGESDTLTASPSK
jgi:hypothetical protein